MSFLTPVLLLALLTLSSAATLRIYEASSTSPETGNPLPSSVTLCPAKLFSSTFTVECVPDAPAISASFRVDGAFVRTERVRPYILTGDNSGFARPWDFPAKATVECMASNGEVAESVITFACPDDNDEEEDDAPEPKPAPRKTPTPQVPKPEPVVQEQKPNPPAAKSGSSGGFNCIRVAATNYITTSSGWVKRNGGMAYKPDDPSIGIDGKDEAPMTYKFKASASSRYVISIDMETNDGSEHNDIWIEFPSGGVSLEKPGSKSTDSSWVKAYHNKNGRATNAFSVDHNPHVISTKNSLTAGQEYIIKLGGRSTRVTVFSIVMFSCSGDQCMAGNYYNSGNAQCS